MPSLSSDLQPRQAPVPPAGPSHASSSFWHELYAQIGWRGCLIALIALFLWTYGSNWKFRKLVRRRVFRPLWWKIRYARTHGVPPNRLFSPEQRKAIGRRDGWRCNYCAATGALDVDHIIPWSHGGPTAVDNGQLLCAPCNRELKGFKREDEARREFFRRRGRPPISGMDPPKHSLALWAKVYKQPYRRNDRFGSGHRSQVSAR